jgi:uncharacterized protein (DUF1778 family)
MVSFRRLTVAQETQISASVSMTTREKLDRFTESRGLKKNFVVEQALLYFMESRRELPDEAFIPSKVVLEDAAFDRLTKLLKRPPKPTRALVELMRGK